MNQIIFILSALLILTACSSKKPAKQVEIKPVPSWYTTPPVSNQQTLYATGQGATKEIAVSNALNNMASTLSVSIASTFESTATERRGIVNTSDVKVSSTVQSDIEKIRISHYAITAYEMRTMTDHYVLIESDKRKLYESLVNELNQTFTLLTKRGQTYQKLNILERIHFYKEAASSIKDVDHTLIVLDVLHPGFDAGPYIEKIDSINKAFREAMDAISFSFQNDGNSENLVAPIKAALTEQGFQIANRKDKDHLVIKIKSDTEKADAMGFILARSSIRITVEAQDGSVIGGNKLNITGQSSQNYAIAKENIAIQLNNQIHEESIDKVLGITL